MYIQTGAADRQIPLDTVGSTKAGASAAPEPDALTRPEVEISREAYALCAQRAHAEGGSCVPLLVVQPFEAAQKDASEG